MAEVNLTLPAPPPPEPAKKIKCDRSEINQDCLDKISFTVNPAFLGPCHLDFGFPACADLPLRLERGLEELGIRATWEGARRICQTAKAARPTERARRIQRREVCRSRERQIHKYGKPLVRAGAPFATGEGPLRAERAGASESLGWGEVSLPRLLHSAFCLLPSHGQRLIPNPAHGGEQMTEEF